MSFKCIPDKENVCMLLAISYLTVQGSSYLFISYQLPVGIDVGHSTSPDFSC